MSDPQHLHVSWDAYHDLIEQLALLVDDSGWAFDQVLCLARGGLRPGDVLSRIFDKPLAVLSTSSYRAESGTVQGELQVSDRVTMARGRLQGRVLLVDDLVDSGVTLAAVCAHLRAQSHITELRTAVIWHKPGAAFDPDFCVQRLTHNPWIHQPFERYDELRPQDLRVRRRP
jgi:hypoxanthine phosphoribosyltransferase